MNRKLRVYVAGPFTAPTRGGVMDNVDRAIRAGEEVDKIQGCSSFVPHCWSRWDDVCPGGYERWMEKCFDELARSDALFVMQGSPGTNREIDFAHSRGIPVAYTLEELRLWAPTLQKGLKP